LKKLIKVLHEIAAIGVAGSLTACIVLLTTTHRQSPVEFAAVCRGIAAIAQWMLLPSLAIVLISGLLSIAANAAYINAGWPWMKALLGISTFEGTLLTINGSARQAAELSALATSGAGDPARLAVVMRTEWVGLWVILLLSLANVALAVWRPKFSRSRPET